MKHLCFALSLLFLLFVSSCSSGKISFISDSDHFTESLSEDIIWLSEEDALTVARLYKEQYQTKSANYIKDVFAYKDSLSTPIMYAVNYNEGCVLVSATKKYHPILAVVEKGNIYGETGKAPDIFIQQYIDEISAISKDNDSPILKDEWRRFEKHKAYITPRTKVNADYYDILDEFYDDWYDSGYEFTHLNTPFDDMPESIYDTFCSQAEDTDYIGYNYMECALIGRCDFSSNQMINPMITSTWYQLYPYNNADPTHHALGCSTIASGQIMRYYQFPASFYWAGMPNSLSSPDNTLCAFLQSLKSAIGVDTGGGATIYQVKNALQGYGYSCSIQSHNISAINSFLQAGKPVYCRGKEVHNHTSHAWICDGRYQYESHTRYVLFTLIFQNGAPLGFEEYVSYTIYSPTYTLYHINWGQNGSFDGYYYDSNLQFTTISGQQDYTSNDRQELFFYPGT